MIRFANYTQFPFCGWRRITVDHPMPFPAGEWGDGTRYVVSGSIGLDLWALDIHAALDPGEVKVFDPNSAVQIDYEPVKLGTSWQHYGLPTVNGESIKAGTTVTPGGAGIELVLWQRISPMLVAYITAVWNIGEPYVTGELRITASNPTIPDMSATIPADLTFTWGDAIVVVTGLDRIRGTPIADGQSHCLPFIACWHRQCNKSEILSAMALQTPGGVCGCGLDKIWPTGDPLLVGPAASWARRWLPEALDALGTMQESGLGPAAYSGRTGAQEDQVFVGAEMAEVEGLGSETVRYLTALGMSRFPMHHLEASGRLLDIDRHEGLSLWNARPHYNTGISPDQLGKPRALRTEEASGWSGPDEEHLLINTLGVAYRATGSAALQFQLGAHARNLLFHFRRPAEWGVGALRAVGWQSLAAWWLWHTLRDRALAEQVKEDWIVLADSVIAAWGNQPWWWVTYRDSRLAGTGRDVVAMLWQHGLCTYALDLAGEAFGHEKIREFALDGAHQCLEQAFTFQTQPPPPQQRDGFAPGPWRTDERLDHEAACQMASDFLARPEGTDAARWYGWGYVGIEPDGSLSQLVNGDGALWGPGVEAWMALTPATVLRHDRGHRKAREIMCQFIDEANQGGKWIPPEML